MLHLWWQQWCSCQGYQCLSVTSEMTSLLFQMISRGIMSFYLITLLYKKNTMESYNQHRNHLPCPMSWSESAGWYQQGWTGDGYDQRWIAGTGCAPRWWSLPEWSRTIWSARGSHPSHGIYRHQNNLESVKFVALCSSGQKGTSQLMLMIQSSTTHIQQVTGTDKCLQWLPLTFPILTISTTGVCLPGDLKQIILCQKRETHPMHALA